MQTVIVTFRLFTSVSPVYWYLNSIYSREIAGILFEILCPIMLSVSLQRCLIKKGRH